MGQPVSRGFNPGLLPGTTSPVPGRTSRDLGLDPLGTGCDAPRPTAKGRDVRTCAGKGGDPLEPRPRAQQHTGARSVPGQGSDPLEPAQRVVGKGDDPL